MRPTLFTLFTYNTSYFLREIQLSRSRENRARTSHHHTRTSTASMHSCTRMQSPTPHTHKCAKRRGAIQLRDRESIARTRAIASVCVFCSCRSALSDDAATRASIPYTVSRVVAHLFSRARRARYARVERTRARGVSGFVSFSPAPHVVHIKGRGAPETTTSSKFLICGVRR